MARTQTRVAGEASLLCPARVQSWTTCTAWPPAGATAMPLRRRLLTSTHFPTCSFPRDRSSSRHISWTCRRQSSQTTSRGLRRSAAPVTLERRSWRSRRTQRLTLERTHAHILAAVSDLRLRQSFRSIAASLTASPRLPRTAFPRQQQSHHETPSQDRIGACARIRRQASLATRSFRDRTT